MKAVSALAKPASRGQWLMDFHSVGPGLLAGPGAACLRNLCVNVPCSQLDHAVPEPSAGEGEEREFLGSGLCFVHHHKAVLLRI